MPWVVVIGVVAIVALFLFRSQLAALLDRTRGLRVGPLRVSTGSSRTHGTEQASPQTVEDLLRAFDSPMLREQEEAIKSDIANRGLGDTSNTIKVLVRHLAATQIALLFNRIDQLIFGTQLTLLRFLNASPNGGTYEQAKIFYGKAVAESSDFSSDFTFEEWISFLRSYTLCTELNGNLWITQRGREFLTYLTQQGRETAWRSF